MAESVRSGMSNKVAKLSFWGVRGSTPTVDRATWRYGGNTPCLELVAPDGTQFILDCGTGLRVLGKRWAEIHGTNSIVALRRLGALNPRTYFCDAAVVYFAAYARSTAVFKSSLRVRIARTGIFRSPIFMTPRGSSANA